MTTKATTPEGGSDRLYRVREPRSAWDPISSAELANSLVALDPCGDRPDYPAFPEEVWYCEGEDCTVRQVLVHHKHLDGIPEKRKRLHCPACGAPMRFLYCVREVVLVRA
jgi:hypothetical protein